MTFEISRTIELESGMQAFLTALQAQWRGETVQTHIIREHSGKHSTVPFARIDHNKPLTDRLRRSWRLRHNVNTALKNGESLGMVVGRNRESFESF